MERQAHFRDDAIDAALDVDEDVFAPEARRNLLARHQLPWSARQQDQQFHRLPLEPHRSSIPQKPVSGDVRLKHSMA